MALLLVDTLASVHRHGAILNSGCRQTYSMFFRRPFIDLGRFS